MSEKIARLPFDALAPEVQDVLLPRVKRLGYLGEFFQCTGIHPDILTPFMHMTEALKHALPDRLTETGALSVAMFMKNDYERHQHERLSCKLGFGADWVAAVENLAPDRAPLLSDEERAVQRLVIAMLERRALGVGPELQAVIDILGAEQAIAILFLVGRYVTHALIVNSLELAPPVPSIFAAEY
jgi:hypothetical protein